MTHRLPSIASPSERIHSGAHYPSDVAAGTVIGLTSAGLVHAAPRLLLRRWLHTAC